MRRNSTLKYLVYLLVFILITGCDFASLKDPIILTEVEDEFRVNLWETLAPTKEERQLLIKIESIKTEKCLNYRIDYQFNKDGNRLKIALNNLIKPLDCVPGEATVKADINTGVLQNGIYSFNIDLKNTIVNDGQLTVRSDSYTLDMQSKNGFSLEKTELRRVPEGAIWGFVIFQQAGDEPIANKFLEDLKKISQIPDGYPAGYYGHFNIATNRDITIYEQPFALYIKPLLYHYTEESAALKNLVNQYRQNYGNRLTIKLYNYKGETI